MLLGSLSNNVFERRTSTGSGLFSFFDGGFAQIFSQIASITVKKLRNTNFISSRHVKRENTSLPVDVRRSKTSLLKLPISLRGRRTPSINFWSKSKSLVSGFPTNQCEIEYSQNGVRDETSASFSEFSYWSKQNLRLFCSAKT